MTAAAEALAFTIDTAESLAFARLSGDFNPLHVDAVAARRLQFGHTVCHGANLVLRSIDLLARDGALEGRALLSVSAVFQQAVLTGTRVQMRIQHDPATRRFKLAGQVGGRSLFTVQLSLGEVAHAPAVDTQAAEAEMPRAPAEPAFPADDSARLALASTVPLRLNPALFESLFPALAAWPDGMGLAAELSASTNIVGMRCPGQHSIYSQFKLQRRASPASAAEQAYQVTLADPRFQLVRLTLQGALLEGTLEAFFRAPPVRQRTLAQVMDLTAPGCTAGQKALVVGGSRGLGELVAKMLLAGGAEVTVTYARGRADAEATVADAAVLGACCTALQVGAGAPLPPDTAAAIAAADYTHLYHFATPPIAKSPGGHWSQSLFEGYCRVYVGGLADLARAAAGGAAPLRVFYPSTVFLDQPEKGFAEYCAAKAAGETLCEHLALDAAHFAVQHPRLPRMRTDQNSSFLGPEADDPFPTMARMLQDFCGWLPAP